jgi:hypothetical protein
MNLKRKSAQERMAEVRKRARSEGKLDNREIEKMMMMQNLAQQRYLCHSVIVNHLCRITQLDIDFDKLLKKQNNWPTPLAHGLDLYSDFYYAFHSLAKNFVCASCGIIGHDVALFHSVSVTDPILHSLSIAEDVYVPFDFSSGISALDQQQIMIDKQGLFGESEVILCKSCYRWLQSNKRPDESLANFRWVGPVPDELQGLTWLEELLIARGHLLGRIVRLQERAKSSYFALKGHTVLLPQDTTRLLDLLPLSPSSLPDVIRVVWTGKSAPDKARLRSYFTVRRQKVYDALNWLCRHHEDYRHVTIDQERISMSESTVVATELLDSIAHMADSSTEDASRSGFAVEDHDIECFEGDIPLTISGIVDVNDITQPPEVTTLQSLVHTQMEAQNQIPVSSSSAQTTAYVVTGIRILSDFHDPTYFTSAFPTIFPYGTGKHLDSRRHTELHISKWVELLLKHSSRFIYSLYP